MSVEITAIIVTHNRAHYLPTAIRSVSEQTLANERYEILEKIGEGGMAVAYRGRDRVLGRVVAIKVMREGPFAGDSDRARFDREVKILGQLDHSNIVTIHDTGVAAGFHYFVVDYVSVAQLDSKARPAST